MRYLRFRNWLDDLNYNREITSVYFEEVRRHIGTDAAHVYGGFLGTLTAWCEDHKLPYQGVPVSHIKRQVTGKGNASKQEVIEAVRALGYRPKDDNEADALAIIEWVLKGAS
jgi:Holliday junction resolvasome RuvABC endonuclease subunit